MNTLVLEASTSSAKALRFNTLTGEYKISSDSIRPKKGDITKQNPKAVYSKVCSVAKKVTEGNSIDAVVLVGTWHSILLCDDSMNPITQNYLWSNTEAKEIARHYRNSDCFSRWYYKLSGCMPNAIYPFYKILFLKEKGYPINTSYLLSQGDYINYRLTNKLTTTPCLASGTGLLDINKRIYSTDLLNKLDIKENQLPTIVGPKDWFPLSTDGACDLGLSEGIPVFPCNSDGGLNQLGSAAWDFDTMTLSVGTSGALRLHTKSPALPAQPSTWCYLFPDGWLSGAATNGACNCLDWLIEKISINHQQYDFFENHNHSEVLPPTFLPFVYGERCPGWEDDRLGGFVNLQPEHNFYHLYEAAQQGILFNLYQCYLELLGNNVKPKSIRLSGGIINSNKWIQMCADIFQTEINVDSLTHSSLLGGVVHAIRSLADTQMGAINDLLKPASIYQPNPERKGFYDELFNRYLEAYRS